MRSPPLALPPLPLNMPPDARRNERRIDMPVVAEDDADAAAADVDADEEEDDGNEEVDREAATWAEGPRADRVGGACASVAVSLILPPPLLLLRDAACVTPAPAPPTPVMLLP